jgi:hypothetical protein
MPTTETTNPPATVSDELERWLHHGDETVGSLIELFVRSRWDTFLGADRASRGDAFAAYVAALDAEAAAAGDLADASSDLAEAA